MQICYSVGVLRIPWMRTFHKLNILYPKDVNIVFSQVFVLPSGGILILLAVHSTHSQLTGANGRLESRKKEFLRFPF